MKWLQNVPSTRSQALFFWLCDLSAELPASLGACVCIKQVGSLHTEIVNALYIAHENYPVFFSCAAALWYILYHAGSKERRTAGHENVLSSVYVLDLVLRVNIHKHTSGPPGRQSKLTHNELSAVMAWLLFVGIQPPRLKLAGVSLHYPVFCSTESRRCRSPFVWVAVPPVLSAPWVRTTEGDSGGGGCRDGPWDSRGMRGTGGKCHVVGKACSHEFSFLGLWGKCFQSLARTCARYRNCGSLARAGLGCLCPLSWLLGPWLPALPGRQRWSLSSAAFCIVQRCPLLTFVHLSSYI